MVTGTPSAAPTNLPTKWLVLPASDGDRAYALAVGLQFPQVAKCGAGRRDHHRRRGVGLDHGHEVAFGIGHLRAKQRVRHRAVAGDQRVAIGCALGHEIGADDAARARFVVNDDALAELLAQALRDQTRVDVARSACGERQHQPDRLVGPGALRQRGQTDREQAGQQE